MNKGDTEGQSEDICIAEKKNKGVETFQLQLFE